MFEGMALYAVFGHPVGHSLSPVIHNAAFQHEHMACFYLPVEVRPEELEMKLQAFRQLGGQGVNLTRPLKETVRDLLSGASEWATATGAANLLRWQDDGWYGDNTDAQSLEANLQPHRSHHRSNLALVAGTGGAARASAVALAHQGYQVVVAARRPERVSWTDAVWPWDRAMESREHWDIVVNATPLGQDGEASWSRLPPMHPEETVVVDWVYRPRRTALLNAAEQAHCPIIDGLSLLIDQARMGWQVWFGRLGPKTVMWQGVEPWL